MKGRFHQKETDSPSALIGSNCKQRKKSSIIFPVITVKCDNTFYTPVFDKRKDDCIGEKFIDVCRNVHAGRKKRFFFLGFFNKGNYLRFQGSV
ncbi:MAG TPA: hypothetical protein VFT06_04105, partial [Flavisolibacter sp.]|nr:hypothetical protein [Flavisolibacter sp.]